MAGQFSKSDTRMTSPRTTRRRASGTNSTLAGTSTTIQLTGGLWYRGLPIAKAYKQGYGNNDAVILMAGFQTQKQLRIIYSYDITISKLTMRSGGAHEISLQYEWPRKAKNRKHRTVPCPKF